jgi:hypothetical protein
MGARSILRAPGKLIGLLLPERVGSLPYRVDPSIAPSTTARPKVDSPKPSSKLYTTWKVCGGSADAHRERTEAASL